MPHIIMTCLSFFIETEQLAESIADTSAHLQCSTFTTRRTTEKVCDEGGYKMRGAMRSGSSSSEWMAEMTRLVPVSFSLCSNRYMATIARPPTGSKNKKPVILRTEHGHKGQAKVKGCAAQADNYADNDRKNYPFNRYNCAVDIVFYFMFDHFIHNLSPHMFFLFILAFKNVFYKRTKRCYHLI